MEYKFLKIDRNDPALPQLAEKYKALRLEGLRQSPNSFSSTFEHESQYSIDVWISRLQNPNKETFICEATNGETTEWVAQVTLLGPSTLAHFQLVAPEAQQPELLPDEEEEKWQMSSLYSLPTHRGKGLAKGVCQEALRYVQTRKESTAPKALVRLMAKADNLAALSMYTSMGFTQAGICTLAEGLIANGEAALIPSGELGPQYTWRGGVIMFYHLDRQA